jgi:hypothetical protein
MTITDTLYKCAKIQSFKPLLKHRATLEAKLQHYLSTGDSVRDCTDGMDVWLHVEYIADRWMCASKIAWLLKQLDEIENV